MPVMRQYNGEVRSENNGGCLASNANGKTWTRIINVDLHNHKQRSVLAALERIRSWSISLVCRKCGSALKVASALVMCQAHIS